MTTIASFGSVGRINIDDPTSFSESFVFNKLLELSKVPFMNPFVPSCSSSDVTQVFHNDNISFVQTVNDFSTNIMVSPTHQPLPSTPDFFKPLPGSRCAFALEFTSNTFNLSPFMFEPFSEEITIGSHSEFIYSQVNTQNVSFMECRANCRSINLFGKSKQEKTSSLFINSQETFSDFPIIKIFRETLWNSERNFNSTINSSQTQDISFLDRSTTREVISHTDIIDSWLTFSSFEHTTGLFDTSNSQLGLQTHFFKVSIDKRVESDIIFDMFIPSNINTELQSFFIDFESFIYQFIPINFNFCSDSTFHSNLKEQLIFKCFGENKNEVTSGNSSPT